MPIKITTLQISSHMTCFRFTAEYAFKFFLTFSIKFTIDDPASSDELELNSVSSKLNNRIGQLKNRLNKRNTDLEVLIDIDQELIHRWI